MELVFFAKSSLMHTIQLMHSKIFKKISQEERKEEKNLCVCFGWMVSVCVLYIIVAPKFK
jgi:hypothetical protein